MSTKDSKRINVTFPVALLEDLRKYVPKRERNRFIVKATEKFLKQVKLNKVIKELRQAPAWSDEDHPDLATVEDVNNYVRRMRAAWMPRSWDEIVGEAEKVD